MDRPSLRELPLRGKPIELVFQPGLTICAGRLLSAQGRGTEVHAGTFIRKRRIVLDSSLRQEPRELGRILRHELFHFVWPRLGNAKRLEYERMIGRELAASAPGELGWSSEWRKAQLTQADASRRTARWRTYLCESFCDTGAWRWHGGRHREFTLARDWRALRRSWWDERLGDEPFPV